MLPNLLNPVSAPRSQDKSQWEIWLSEGAQMRGASVFGKEEQEVIAAPTIHSSTATYAGIGPSLAGQPRSRAHLLPMPPLGEGAYYKDLATAVVGT